jgi:hypothetical protein
MDAASGVRLLRLPGQFRPRTFASRLLLHSLRRHPVLLVDPGLGIIEPAVFVHRHSGRRIRDRAVIVGVDTVRVVVQAPPKLTEPPVSVALANESLDESLAKVTEISGPESPSEQSVPSRSTSDS